MTDFVAKRGFTLLNTDCMDNKWTRHITTGFNTNLKDIGGKDWFTTHAEWGTNDNTIIYALELWYYSRPETLKFYISKGGDKFESIEKKDIPEEFMDIITKKGQVIANNDIHNMMSACNG